MTEHPQQHWDTAPTVLDWPIFFPLSFLWSGDIVCEQLPTELHLFSIASNGRRCILENYVSPTDRKLEYECKTSQVAVDIMHEWIETDDCINAYGVDRESVGISSDALLQPHFTAKLCSSARYLNCPNIVDLYFNLALGEGNSRLWINPCHLLWNGFIVAVWKEHCPLKSSLSLTLQSLDFNRCLFGGSPRDAT